MNEEIRHIEWIASLIIKLNDEEISDSEYEALMDWKNASVLNLRLFEELSDPNNIRRSIKQFPAEQERRTDWEKIMSAIAEEDVAVMPARRMNLRRFVIAASLIGVLSTGTWIFFQHRSSAKLPQALSVAASSDIDPGGNKATLTLANGQKIVLDDVKAGALTEQGATNIIKKDDATLSYTSAGSNGTSSDEVLAYNTLTTPRAGTFVVELPDHSKAWLNSQSSLRYPTTFKGQSKRTVELNGEAFFEIAKDGAHPFNVKVGNRLIEVLGTSFNIQSYSDEQEMEATLVSGAVKVLSGGGQTRVLNPGEQASIPNGSGEQEITLKKVDDLKQITAWKDGLFFFHDNDIQSVMRQLARWYDVEIVYEGKRTTTDRFSGMIRRDKKASDVLKVLALSDVRFRIEGKKIVVIP